MIHRPRSVARMPGFAAVVGTVLLAAPIAASAHPAPAGPELATQEISAEEAATGREAAEQEADAGRDPAAIRVEGSTVLLAGDLARLELELSSGSVHTIELDEGRVVIDGDEVGAYTPGGAFERAWRELLRDPVLGDTEGLGRTLADWEPPSSVDAGAPAPAAVLAALDRLAPPTADPAGAPAVDGAEAHVTIAPRAGSIRRLADRLRTVNETLGRISGEGMHVDGDFALVVHDDYRISGETTIEGDVALLGGRLTVDGDIEGDVLVLGGELRLEPGALVTGDVRSFGGDVETTGATVTGEILSLSAGDGFTDPPGGAARGEPAGGSDHANEWRSERRGRGFFGSITRNVGRTVSDLVGALVWLISLTLLGALLVYFARDRLDAVAGEARADLLRSFGVGLAAEFLFFPVLILLVVLIVTWLVVPFYLLAAAIAVPAGYLAVARGIGEAVVDRRYDLFERWGLNRQNTYYYVLNGLIVLLAPFAVAALLQLFGGLLDFLRGLLLFAAVVLNWAAVTTGVGAMILTRGGGLVRDFPGFRRRRKVPVDDATDPAASPGDPPSGDPPSGDGESDDA